MPTATRTAGPTGAVQTDAGAVAVGTEPRDEREETIAGEETLAALAGRHELPLVVIDLERARRQYRRLRDAFPWVDVHYDVSALAHPDLIATVAERDGGFEVTHEQALPALLRVGADPRRLMLAAPSTHPASTRAAYDLGVRRFVVGGMRDLAVLAQLPANRGALRPLLRLRPSGATRPAHRAPGGVSHEEVLDIARAALNAGLPIAGLSLTVPAEASPAAYVTEIVHAMGVAADIEAATGSRLPLLDLGEGFPGRAASRPAERAELARAIRGIVAPATSGIIVTASAGRAVTAGCLLILGGTVERDVEPSVASACIDAGAEVVVLRDEPRRFPGIPLFGVPFFRGRSGGAHRVLRPRGSQAWSAG
ncbi:hypothetical protein [Leifsonia sp. NPDC080035]|uniref:Orn/DAP/Arg decarboxylase 2 N-terminal domain-containing protein n=1 Tax=Leifsonia sp. NPDC080035 TaxID=3143936 RepID=A0AAU7GE32_9MICO